MNEKVWRVVFDDYKCLDHVLEIDESIATVNVPLYYPVIIHGVQFWNMQIDVRARSKEFAEEKACFIRDDYVWPAKARAILT